MSYPDNYSGRAFERRYGRPADDWLQITAETHAEEHVAALAKLRDAAQALVALIDATTLPVEPGRGYDLADVRAAVADLAGVDLSAFRTRLIERSMEVA